MSALEIFSLRGTLKFWKISITAVLSHHVAITYSVYTFVCLENLCLPYIFIALNGGGGLINLYYMGIIYMDTTRKSSDLFEVWRKKDK